MPTPRRADARVKVWATAPLLDEAREADVACARLLAALTAHAGAVRVVRWSRGGGLLASGSYDGHAMLWARAEGAGPAPFGGSPGEARNVEHWVRVALLAGHSSEICDLAWSADDGALVTCRCARVRICIPVRIPIGLMHIPNVAAWTTAFCCGTRAASRLAARARRGGWRPPRSLARTRGA